MLERPLYLLDDRARIRMENIDLFNKGTSQILVATASMEEGIDIQACNVVICFDKFHNVKSHVQRAGRARDESAMIFYFENDPDTSIRNASVIEGAGRVILAESSCSFSKFGRVSNLVL